MANSEKNFVTDVTTQRIIREQIPLVVKAGDITSRLLGKLETRRGRKQSGAGKRPGSKPRRS